MSFWSSLLAFRRKLQPPRSGLEPPPGFKERFKALANLPLFFQWIWQTSPALTIASTLLRLVRAAVPLATLYLGKLIIDEVLRLTQLPAPRDLAALWRLVGLEFGVICFSDILNRGLGLVDSILGDRFTNQTSVRA